MATRQGGLGCGRKVQHGSRRMKVTTCHAFGPPISVVTSATPNKASFSVPSA
eukprot:CAMPEP_0172798010 /NCGR_PEP_ID=MMETSP1075-20121228/820_1 /TAXON_ID=2916 /ORGANISM="Ceratium fusus, Strain PA161109" /LENGTH=51 /DNA_ID=CAMNT_0013635357 /DNA_START=28 /DNA_END=180 /DNA_ORIENTATION=+